MCYSSDEIKKIYRVKFGETNTEFYDFESIKKLLTFLKNPESGVDIVLRDCLHPSEYDKAPTLLLCRSIAKLRGDLIGEDEGSGMGISEPKTVIPLNQLSRFTNEKFLEDKYTNSWKGCWQYGIGKKKVNKTVTIKQLKQDVKLSKLADFSHVSYNVMMWSDRYVKFKFLIFGFIFMHF